MDRAIDDETSDHDAEQMLTEIRELDTSLLRRFDGRLALNQSLNRQIVSYQANKTSPGYRWYKFKEAFSERLVEQLLSQHAKKPGRLLDPFAGSGTALFASSNLGYYAEGIELLPIGQEIITARELLIDSPGEIRSRLKYWAEFRPWNDTEPRTAVPTLKITRGAYPPQTEAGIMRYMTAMESEVGEVRKVLQFALLCVLESVSYTRKDGQYLRWDSRSGRGIGSRSFSKGPIASFDRAISAKLNEIIDDTGKNHGQTRLISEKRRRGKTQLHRGSCLDILPTLEQGGYDIVMTSPPYCNRYDYTRTYALELALLGIDEDRLIKLRQSLLSATVENRSKSLLEINPAWKKAISAFNRQELLQSILAYLEIMKDRGMLNNNGIPRMVRGYFEEMACVIYECSRVLHKDSIMFVVNDNVRYAGASVSVDLILSAIAEKLGFDVENIFVLPNGKGNSSQQMGRHGREALRKCVYVWRKK